MKAISIRQPWADLIVSGYKKYENRTWYSFYRGPLLIHAPRRSDLAAFEYFRFKEIIVGAPDMVKTGGIVGIAECMGFVDEYNKEAQEDEFFEGPYAFVLQKPRRLPFFACPGKLGFVAVMASAVILLVRRRNTLISTSPEPPPLLTWTLRLSSCAPTGKLLRGI